MRFSASAGGGMVEATVTGAGSLVSITISPEAVDPEDVEMLQDMIVASVNEALKNASTATNDRMNSIMGGMNIPGFM
jgi:DNA-binding YbaB/EbfC family protein